MEAAETFAAACDAALAAGDHGSISDAELARVLTAAVRLYANRTEATDQFPPPLEANAITATEVVIAITEMMHAANLNMFDLNMWFGRARMRQ
jgi:hypothetical protein